MSDEKTLLPELLPVPRPVIPSVSPRERVVKHWHTLMTAGAATAALAGCGCLVMDPLPPPAQCRTTRSLLEDVSFSVLSNSSGPELSVQRLTFSSEAALSLLSIEGGTFVTRPSTPVTFTTPLVITPNGTGPITVIFTTTCEGTAATSIKVVLTPQGSDGGADAGPTSWTVSATDL